MWDRPSTYVALMIILLAAAVIVEQLPPLVPGFFAVLDYILFRGALVALLYLLWRLVVAYERRVRVEEARRGGKDGDGQ